MGKTNIDWAKWNRQRFIEKVKCFFGFHEMSPFRLHHGEMLDCAHSVQAWLNCKIVKVNA